MTIELTGAKVLLDGLSLPEGPRWRDGKLFFADMHGHRVMTVDPAGHAEVVVEMDDRSSGLGFLPDGSLLIVSMRRNVLLRYDGERLRTFADLGPLTGSFINDMVTDAQGRSYVGARAAKPDGTPVTWGGLVLVTPDGEVTSVAQDLHGPNGTVILPDGKTLVVAETRGNRLTAFTIETDGSLADRRSFAELGEAQPDGICLDAEGGIWLGWPMGREFIRVLEGGEVTHRIRYEDKRPIACMLGGDDGRTLFLLTCRFELQDLIDLEHGLQDSEGKCIGWIESLAVDTARAGLP